MIFRSTQCLLISLALVLLLGQPSYSGVFVPETYPSLNSTTLTNCNKTTPLYVGLTTSFNVLESDGSATVPGVKVALDRINNDCTLLPGYSLHYILADSGCARTPGLDAFFTDILLPGPTKIAVFDSGCSSSTAPTAEVSHYYNITQVSCYAVSPILKDRSRFRRYFQVLSSEDSIALVYYRVIREYGWRYVSIVAQDETLFTVTIERLTGLLRDNGIQYDTKIFSTADGIAGLGNEPFNLSSRIHIIASFERHARAALCKAYSLDIRYPRYLLMFPGWYSRNFWTRDDIPDCTPAQRESVIDRSIAPLNYPLPIIDDENYTADDLSISGVEYFAEEEPFVNIAPQFYSRSEYGPYCFDAAYALAFALNKTLQDLEDPTLHREVAKAYGLGANESFGLNNFDYSSDALTNIFVKHLEKTSFDGLSGHVEFAQNGIRPPNTFEIFQIRKIPTEDGPTTTNVQFVKFGDAVGDANDANSFSLVYLDGESISTVWPDNLIPYDGVPVDRIVTVHIALTVMIILMATAGVVFAIVCIGFNFIFRERKLIKITSPNLNYMIGAGAIVLYVNLYLFVIPTTDKLAVTVLCNITPWLTAIGYSLCYGTVVAKMIRVFYIFDNPTPKPKKAIKDWMLALGVLFLVVIDVVILLVYTAVEGSKTELAESTGLAAKRVVNSENPDDIEGVVEIIIKYFIFICDSQARAILLGILYGYKALLQIIALVFSFSIRKVKVKGLDDAKYIAASIYVSSIVLAVIIVCTYTLKDFINAFAAVFCTGFWIGTSVILALSFIPLMVSLYKDPNGENIFSKSHRSGDGFSTQLSPGNGVQTEMIVTLQRRVSELEGIVSDQAVHNKGENGSIGHQLTKIEEKSDSVQGMELHDGLVVENSNPSTPAHGTNGVKTIYDNQVVIVEFKDPETTTPIPSGDGVKHIYENQ